MLNLVFDLGNGTSAIGMKRGGCVIVDTEDLPKIKHRNWSWSSGCASCCNSHGRIFMHRLLMDAPDWLEVDHKNRQRWDNRKINLRLCTFAENMQNRVKPIRGSSTSRYKGVDWNKQRSMWRVHGTAFGRRTYLGYFHDEREAAAAYNMFALEHQGEFALLNVL